MTKGKAYITAIGHFHPPQVIENQFFSELGIGSDAQWIEDRTGIKSRNSVLDLKSILANMGQQPHLNTGRMSKYSLVDMAELSYQNMLERFFHVAKSEKTIDEVDLLICGTSVPDYEIPSNASYIAHRLGLHATCLDINAACSSFVFDLNVAYAAMKLKQVQKVLIFNPERYTLRLNFQDRSSCVLFGDGASVILLESEPRPGCLELMDCAVGSDPSRADVIKIPVGGFFEQNGPAVQRFAVTKTVEITKSLLEKNHLSFADLSYFVGHQANLRMLESAVSRMGLNADQHFYNVDRFGNQGSAGAPISLSQNWERLASGNFLSLSVVGAGLAWGSCLFKTH